MAVTVRALEPQDWRLIRDLRLRSLAESPDALRPTALETGSMSDDEWRDIVASTTTRPRGLLLVAEEGNEAVGGLFGRKTTTE